MSNSDDTNELDNYGVWVKKPPKDIPVDDSELMDDSFTLDADLPDFSSLEESSVLSEETSTGNDFDISVDGITEESIEDPFADVDFGESTASQTETESKASEEVAEDDFNLDDVTQDIPLDDLNLDVDTDLNLDDPAIEENVEEAINSEPSLDDFNVEEITENTEDNSLDFEIDDNPKTEIATDSGEISVDQMEDGEIDLDNFLDDSTSETTSDGDSVDVSADFGLDEGSSDNVDLGDFLGDGELSDFTGDSSPKTEEITEEDPLDINLSFDESANSFAVEEDSESDEIAAAETSSEESISDSGDIATESIDISDFGIGDEEDSEFSIPEESAIETKPEVVDYDMKVTADNDDDVKVSMNDVITGNIDNDNNQDAAAEETSFTDDAVEDTEISAKGQEILQQIVGELASLKDEIKNLKTDFAEIKSHGSDFEIKEQEEENTGFFSDGDEDDTIALSGDELSNILNNAEFLDEAASQDNAEETSTGTDIIEEDISDETTVSNGQFESSIDESAFDDSSIFDEHADEDIQIDSPEISEDLPEEIDIPKLDDDSEEIKSSEFSSTIDEDPIDSILAEDAPISDSLTDEKIDYISEDSNNPVEDELADLDLPAPTLEDAFEQKSDVENFKAELGPEDSEPAVSNEEITGDLKSEIKSVLSYMDQLLENLPEDKISEFAQSEHFVTYKKLFQELGLS